MAEVAPNASKIIVVGAGNSNDFDLQWLVSRAAAIHLVDWDSAALTWGVAQQGLQNNPRIHLYGGMELTGIIPPSAADSSTADHIGRETERLHCAQTHVWSGLDSDYDLCVSAGVLSQLLEMTHQIESGRGASLATLLAAVRTRHLELMMRHVRPGGCAVLVTEVVSSDTAPKLAGTSPAELPELLAKCLSERNFFSGLHPGIIAQEWRQLPALAALSERHFQSAPWLWDFGPRTYACFACGAYRKTEG